MQNTQITHFKMHIFCSLVTIEDTRDPIEFSPLSLGFKKPKQAQTFYNFCLTRHLLGVEMPIRRPQ